MHFSFLGRAFGNDSFDKTGRRISLGLMKPEHREFLANAIIFWGIAAILITVAACALRDWPDDDEF